MNTTYDCIDGVCYALVSLSLKDSELIMSEATQEAIGAVETHKHADEYIQIIVNLNELRSEMEVLSKLSKIDEEATSHSGSITKVFRQDCHIIPGAWINNEEDEPCATSVQEILDLPEVYEAVLPAVKTTSLSVAPWTPGVTCVECEFGSYWSDSTIKVSINANDLLANVTTTHND